MKKLFGLFLVAICVFAVTACGEKSNVLVGKWNGDTNDGLNTTFVFKTGGKVEYDNEFGFSSTGTYTIEGTTVKINLESWSEEKAYIFSIDNEKLTLVAQDAYSPSYKDMIKQK